MDANACAVIEEKKIAGKKRLKRSEETESARLCLLTLTFCFGLIWDRCIWIPFFEYSLIYFVCIQGNMEESVCARVDVVIFAF